MRDGFAWTQGLTSNADVWTLTDPSGHMVAHVYRNHDRTWEVIDGEGTPFYDHAVTLREARRAAELEWRLCAWIGTDHGHIIECDHTRSPGSAYCADHMNTMAVAA